jgi:hypothetical protein
MFLVEITVLALLVFATITAITIVWGVMKLDAYSREK